LSLEALPAKDHVHAAEVERRGLTHTGARHPLWRHRQKGWPTGSAAKRAAEIDRLVLLNPQLDYKKRTIDSRAYWHDDQLGEAEATTIRST
jgi:hypothetical protein